MKRRSPLGYGPPDPFGVSAVVDVAQSYFAAQQVAQRAAMGNWHHAPSGDQAYSALQIFQAYPHPQNTSLAYDAVLDAYRVASLPAASAYCAPTGRTTSRTTIISRMGFGGKGGRCWYRARRAAA